MKLHDIVEAYVDYFDFVTLELNFFWVFAT